ncbi:MAG: sugar phosphate isomerase/epimerase [Thermoflexus sp.]|nr:sugar phosphate isomerase/epimerase [Thermoflexus sp.]
MQIHRAVINRVREEIPWVCVLGALKALGYEGYVGLEYVSLGGQFNP